MRTPLLVATIFLGLGLPAQALAAPPAADHDGAAKHSAKDRILGALDLPLKAQALRKSGTDEPAVKAGLKAARERKLEAREAADLLGSAAKAAKDHGPVDNFGAFVQTQLEAGLRGKELAAAIRKDHEARGKGKDGKGNDGKGKGKPDEAKPGEPSADSAAPDEHGKPDEKGAPDDKAKPDEKDDKAKPDEKAADKGKPAEKADDKGKPAEKAADKGKPADKGKSAAETKGKSE